jgi:hypothetical protein
MLTTVDERYEPPRRPSRAARAVHAAASFCTGFAIQIVSLTGRMTADEEQDSRWFARGEWAAYGFIAAIAAVGVALLVSEL